MMSRNLYRGGASICWNYQRSVSGTTIRQYAAQSALKHEESVAGSAESEIKWEQARPFNDIPGPGKLEFIRSVMPGGKYYKKSVSDMVMLMYNQYGKLFRLPGMFGKRDTLMDLNPDDFSIIFRNEGVWPVRPSFDSITYHREVHRRELFDGVEGVLSTSGEKWAKVRTTVNPVLMQPKNARLYLNTMLEVNNEFLQRIREIRDPQTLEMPATFEDEINRLAFESVCAVALNTQLGLIRKNRDSAEAKILIKSLREVFDLAFDLDVLPSLWKIVKTPKFYRMMSTLDKLTDISNKYITEAIAKIEKDTDGKLTSELGKEKSVLEKLLKHDRRIAVVMALDMMMAGVDTTSTTLTGILFCIAKHPEKQQKLRDEMRQILPEKDSLLTMDNMKNLPYLRACIKEGIRMYPIGPGTVRRLDVDVVLSGFQVPKGSDVAIGNNLLQRVEQYVPKANEYLPERWLRNKDDRQGSEIANPFMYLPFGFGPRSCVGKRIVDLELEITLARLVRNFNIEFNYSIENAFVAKFINVPAIPLKFKMAEVED